MDNLNFLQLDESRSVDLPEIMFRSGPGCHQFYSKPTGRITSFNFDRANPDDSRYQPGLRYKMCVNPFGITKCQVSSSIKRKIMNYLQLVTSSKSKIPMSQI